MHKDALAVASVAKDHPPEVVFLGAIGPRPCDIAQLLRQLQSKSQHLVLGDEAGPGGDWRYRDLTKQGHGCWVVAPALMPQQAGDRVNTDRRDAVPLARLRRSGDLTPVSGPKVEAEALRDLRRAREDASRALNAATFRLNAVLRRHDSRDTGQATWGPAHRRGLSDMVCATPAQPIVCQADVRAVTEHTERLPRLAQALHAQGHTWRLQPVVAALHAWRGAQFTGAVTRVAELGDLTRVDHPRPLTSYVGLTPLRRRQG